MAFCWKNFVYNCPDASLYEHATCHTSQANTFPDLKEWSADWLMKPNHSLLFQGEAGRGKTWMIFSMLNAWISMFPRREGSVRFIHSLDIKKMVHAEFLQFKSSHYNAGMLAEDPEVLAIDDLGMEGSGEMIENAIYLIIQTRMNLRKPTIISTNLFPSELVDRYGARISSRLNTYRKIDFVGKDFRAWDPKCLEINRTLC